MESFWTRVASVATGTDKTAINLFNTPATPTNRGHIIYINCVGSAAAAAGDHTADFLYNRTTAVGTEGSGLVPNNDDPAGPAGSYDSGLGVFGGEPTYTAAKQLLAFQLNHRATFQWYAQEGRGLKMAATQNNGAGVKSVTSTSTQAYGHAILFAE